MTRLDTNRLAEYTAPVHSDLEAFDARLHDYLRGDSPLISSIARHLLKSRGKRIRPAFLFLTSRAADNFTEHSVDASLAVELIHTATLLHDDVVDESDLRRGQETVNYKWKNLISVLMGDYIFAKAFRIMADANSLELIDAIARATERVSIGELRQIEETHNYTLSEDEYFEIIADKTASLFSVSCESGPILAGRDTAERQRFGDFGENIGTAFQVADDLLDFIGDPKETGKELGVDTLSGYVTLPLIYSLKSVNEASGREIIKNLKNGNGEETFEEIYSFVEEQGGLDYTSRRATELSERALESIVSVGPSDYYESLINLIRYTVARAS
ncbi:MAG: polyprenyl synthetase family protein [candidate division Zixibacteria bacterium]|nr:polyprenyl synthetase family protein [candidate division Zixibacteria bacterium]